VRSYKSVLLSNYFNSLIPNEAGNASENRKQNQVETLKKVLAMRIKSGEIGRGDQVVIQIMAHGVERSSGETTHSIEVGGQEASLDSLKPVLQTLTDAGVRVALIDGSCYSGASQAFKSDSICVISSQVASRTARFDSGENGTFLNAFWNELKKATLKEKFPWRKLSSQLVPKNHWTQVGNMIALRFHPHKLKIS
jgi:hypothetical protein